MKLQFIFLVLLTSHSFTSLRYVQESIKKVGISSMIKRIEWVLMPISETNGYLLTTLI